MNPEQFAAQHVWSMLDQFNGLLGEVRTKDASASEALSQLAICHSRLISYKRSGSSSFFVSQMFPPVEQQLSNAVANLNAYVQSGNESNLNQAVAHSDAALYESTRWPGPLTTRALTDKMLVEMEDFSNNIARRESKLIASTNQAMEVLSKQTEKFEQDRVSLSEEITRLQNELTASEERHTETQRRLEVSLADFGTAFNAEKAERDTTESNARQNREDSFGKQIGIQDTKFKEHLETTKEWLKEFEVGADAHLKKIEELRTDAETVAGLAVGDLLSDKFMNRSKALTKSAWITLSIAGLAVIAGVLVTLNSFGSVDPTATVSWTFAVSKLTISTAIFGSAGLLFRLGTKFLQEASDTKNLELEMRAIGPFLATLNNTADADGAKIAFLDRRFGKLSTDVGTGGKNGEVSDSAADALEIISKVLERIKVSS